MSQLIFFIFPLGALVLNFNKLLTEALHYQQHLRHLMTPRSLDRLFLSLGFVVLFAAFVASAISKELYFKFFGAEDSLIENATAVFLAIAGGALMVRIFRARSFVSRGALILGVIYGLTYFWAAGEEISWGQRIFGFDSPAYFEENNDQSEFTFHNLVIGGVKLDEVVFGPLLSYIILSYLIILPLLWPRVAWLRSLCDRFVIPVPKTHHALYTLVITVIIPLLDESRRWEVYECIFALLSLAIFIHPANPLVDTTAEKRDDFA